MIYYPEHDEDHKVFEISEIKEKEITE